MHETLIYIDIYFISNYVMDAFLLVVFGWIINIKSSLQRIFCAAGAGALLACMILYFDVSENNVIVNVLILLVMLFIFLYKRVKPEFMMLLRYMVIWCFTAFAAGGILNYISGDGLSIITMLKFTVGAGVAAYAAAGRNRMNKTRMYNDDVYRITIHKDKRSLDGYGLYDSGNSLTEPISGGIVIVGEYGYLCGFLSKGEKNFINLFPELPEVWDGETHIRSIPYCSIDSEHGHLPGIALDVVTITHNGKSRLFCNCYMAVLDRKLTMDGSYNFILQQNMILNN